MSEKKNKIVFVDSKTLSEERELTLGRPLTDVEKRALNKADAIQIDAIACGRTVRETVKNYEMHGVKLSDSVKSVLSLTPSTN
jgi:hypothetical protein